MRSALLLTAAKIAVNFNILIPGYRSLKVGVCKHRLFLGIAVGLANIGHLIIIIILEDKLWGKNGKEMNKP